MDQVVKVECKVTPICDQVVQVAQEVQDQAKVECQAGNQEVIQISDQGVVQVANQVEVECQAGNQEVIQIFAQVAQVANQVECQVDSQEATQTCVQEVQLASQVVTQVTCLETLCRSEQTIETDGLYENN